MGGREEGKVGSSAFVRLLTLSDLYAAERGWDKLISSIGRLTFVDNFAYFPVLYIDEDLTVFKCALAYSCMHCVESDWV